MSTFQIPVLQLQEHRGGLVVDEAPASHPAGLMARGSLLPAVPPPGALRILSPRGGCRGPTLGQKSKLVTAAQGPAAYSPLRGSVGGIRLPGGLPPRPPTPGSTSREEQLRVNASWKL